MKKRKRIKTTEEQWSTIYSNDLLKETFVAGICLEISNYLMPIDLISLYLTCIYFYKTEVLEASFYKHLNCFPATQAHRVLEAKESQTTSFERIKQRIDVLMNLASKEDDKSTIKRWLLINEKRFENNSELFLKKEISTEYIRGFRVRSKTNAHQFFSRVGAVKHMMVMHECINDDALKQGLLEKDCFHAFQLVIEHGNLDMLKLFWNHVIDDDELRDKLLESRYYERSFTDAAERNHLDVLKFLMVISGGYVFWQRGLPRGRILSVFIKSAKKGNVDVVKLLWDFADKDPYLLWPKSECAIIGTCSGHGKLIKLLWEFVGDKGDCLRKELLEHENCFAFYWAASNGFIEVVKLFLNFAIQNVGLTYKLLMTDDGRAFRYAVLYGHVDVVKLLWEFAGNNEHLKYKLLTTKPYNAFYEAAKSCNVVMLKLVWDFTKSYDGLRQEFLTTNGSSAFCSAASYGRINVVNLLWDFAKDYDGLRKEFLTTNGSWAFRSAFEAGLVKMVKLLWNFTRDDKELREQLWLSVRVKVLGSETHQIYPFGYTGSDLDDTTKTARLIGVAATNGLISIVEGHVFKDETIEDIKDLIEDGANVNAYCRQLNSSEEFLLIKNMISFLKRPIDDRDNVNVRSLDPYDYKWKRVLESAIHNTRYMSRYDVLIPTLLLDNGAKITEDNVVPVLRCLRDNHKPHPLIDRIFKIVKEQGLEFDVAEAFKYSPELKIRYQDFSHIAETNIPQLPSQSRVARM